MASNVNIEMQANVGGLNRGLQQGVDGLKKLGNEAKNSSNSIKSLGGAISSEKKIVNQLALQYHSLTDAEKKAFGSDIKSQMDAHIAKLKEYKAVQADINTQISGATSQFGKFGSAVSQAGSQLGLPIGNLTSLLNPTTAAIAGVAALGAAFVATAKKTMEFDAALNDLSVRLNIPQDQLKQFGEDAIDVGNKFGISANEVVKQFQYMAQQAPGLEQDRDGMLALADASNKLSIAFGTDVEKSTDAVMTVLSKFNLTAADSADIANTLAEACRNTGADLEYQSAVFEKVGSAANATGISYQELASATGVLSSTFSDASVVGAGLNTMITKLQKASDEYNPAVVGLEQAVKNMADANLSYADIVSMVGPKAAQVTQVLIDQQSAFSGLQAKMENTQAAEEMFGVKSEELGFVINKIKTMWENFLLKIGESAVFQTVMGLIGDICKWIEELSTEIQEMLDKEGDLNGFAKIWEVIRKAIGALLPVIGAVVKHFIWFYNKVYSIISDVIKIWSNMVNKVIAVIRKMWNGVKAVMDAIYKKLSDNAVFRGVVKVYEWLKNKIISILKKIANAWNEVMKSLGMDSMVIRIGADVQTDTSDLPSSTKPTNVHPTGGGSGSGSGSGGGSGKKGGGGKSKTSSIDIKFEEKSLEWYDNEIKKINDELNSQNLTYDQQQEKIREIVKLERARNRIKQQQDKIKAIAELEAKISPQTFQEIQDKFGSYLGDHIDLFKGVQTDAEAKKIADQFSSAFNERLDIRFPAPDPSKVKPPQTEPERKRGVYDNATKALQELQKDYNIGIIDENEFMRKWEAIKAAVQAEGLTIEVEPELKSTKEWEKNLGDITDAVGSIGDAFGSLGDMTDDPMLKVAGIVAQAIANIALGAGQAVAKAGKLGPWGWLAFGASIMAQMAAMIAQVHSATGMAEGGIVKGSTTIGDRVLTRLNAGEVVLNGRQQANLWRAIDQDRLGGSGYVTLDGDVRIKGSDLYLSLKNHEKITGKKL